MELFFYGVFTMVSAFKRQMTSACHALSFDKAIPLLLSCLLFSIANVQANNSANIDVSDPKAWIDWMNDESNQVEMDGYFSYQRGSHTSSYHYIRQIVDNTERQRLIFLDGEEQELICESGILRWLHLKNGESKPMQGSAVRSLFNIPKDFADVWQFYDALFLKDTRIAGREAKLVKLKPKDDNRFPFVFAIDKQQGVMLEMQITSDSSDVFERFRYISINFDDVTSSQFEHGLKNYTADALVVYPGEQYSPAKAKLLYQSKLSHNAHLSLAWLPQGFVEKTQLNPVSSASSRTFSDGLSSFSVFVETLADLDPSVDDTDSEDGDQKSISTFSNGTAFSARYMKSAEGNFQVTVVGELPLATVEKISSQLVLK
jgi:sigma-E factor negative regulatory protein RseB